MDYYTLVKKFKRALINAINDGKLGEEFSASSFEEAGVLTMNDGVQVWFPWGLPLQMEFLGVMRSDVENAEEPESEYYDDDEDE